MAQTEAKPVILGRISGLFGVRGWVRIHSYTDPREAILNYANWLIETAGEWRPMRVAEGKPHGKTVVVRLDGIEDRDAAAELMQCSIGVERSNLPAPGQGEYYWSDLEGLTVEQDNGEIIGTVAYLIETGANDVLVVRKEEQEVLIPFVTGEVIKDVDLTKGVIRVSWEWD
ncbi:MAG: ribosome maturation factor RimM [Gammaproteobacteria bacterium]|nr:ribosome maturation factor RimM [Gammaproteobacteria bacterium]